MDSQQELGFCNKKVLESHEVLEDAVDLAVNATGPVVDHLLPHCSVKQSPALASTALCGFLNEEDEEEEKEEDFDEQENVCDRMRDLGLEDVRDNNSAATVAAVAYSRSSTFSSERSVESCDSFVSAASKLEPDAERDELLRMFNMFDENGDGKISDEELGNTMRKLGFGMSDDELMTMVRVVDKDGDGFVDFDEFMELYSVLYHRDEDGNTKLDEKEEELVEAFRVFDKNNDGYISVVELQSVLGSLGMKEGAKLIDCQKMITAVDVDGDGRVNFEEFKQMMTSSLFN